VCSASAPIVSSSDVLPSALTASHLSQPYLYCGTFDAPCPDSGCMWQILVGYSDGVTQLNFFLQLLRCRRHLVPLTVMSRCCSDGIAYDFLYLDCFTFGALHVDISCQEWRCLAGSSAGVASAAA
jgi:hypothetical protein